MPKELTVRRKHLSRPFKAIDGDKVKVEHIKDQRRARRASRITFYDDNTGDSRILMEETTERDT